MKTRLIAPLLLIPALVFAAVADFPLKRTVKVGDSVKYSHTFVIEEEGEKIEISGETVTTVKKINDDGSLEIEDSNKTTKMTMSGEVIDMSDEEADVSTSVQSPSGGILSVSDFDDDPMTFRISQATSFRYPEKAVEKGGKWEVDFKADAKRKTPAATAIFELEGPDSYQGFKCFKVKYTYRETEGNDPTTTKGSFWIREEDGLELKAELEVKNLPMDEETQLDCRITSEIVK